MTTQPARSVPNWVNRTIWTGDNLDIMRGMNGETVDLIYLDPPFNSNEDYSAPIGSDGAIAAFKDTWTLSDVDEAWHGLIAEEEPGLYRIIDMSEHSQGKSLKSYLIMMSVRLLEMRRLLKPTGAVYLHCDTTASHYLKMVMDTVFGDANYRNEISWKRVNGRGDGKRFGRVSDRILYYTKSDRYTWRSVYVKDPEYVRNHYKLMDERGLHRLIVLTGPGISRGESGAEWNGYNPTAIRRHWSVPRTGRYAEWIEANILPGYRNINSPHARLDALSEADMIVWSKNGTPNLKSYADAYRGTKINDIFVDIPQVRGKEAVGYPTQKPLALLRRLIEASSNPGDIVLDPFAGCATACVAAEALGRQWVGIDLSPVAATLVRRRLASEVGLSGAAGERAIERGVVTHRNDIPRRSDLGKLPSYRTHKRTLFGRQGGICAGCEISFPFRNFTVDHILAQSRGGTDHIDNLQLLCGACNSTKGSRSQEEFIARLRRDGLRD